MTVRLRGFAELPADTFAAGPPAGEGISANDRTGPFEGQPVQGFSAVQYAEDDSFWFLSDNGFGSKENSSDYLLRLYKVDPSFRGTELGNGSVEVQDFITLSDPNNLVPFDIENEGSEERLLTGSDFDTESFTIAEDGSFWVGDEFGPYLLHFNQAGELIEPPVSTPNYSNLDTLNGQSPLVIGHRGASGLRPEHTLASYKLAIEKGADFIEPDLVSTKDGVLVARHENQLSGTTDVEEHPEFADRKTTKTIDGEEVTGWFTEDFTLEELKTLNAEERLPELRGTEYDGDFEIPTFKEIINLVKQAETETGREIGIYPETKHPTYFDSMGLSLEEPLIDTLKETGFTDPDQVFIQSFEVGNLQYLDETLMPKEGVDLPLVQLIGGSGAPYDLASSGDSRTYADLATPEGLAEVATYADGIGPSKRLIVPTNEEGELQEPTDLVEDAHAAGLLVHPYTFRSEDTFLAPSYENPEEEYEQFIQLGVDGYFSDYPGVGDEVRDEATAELVRSPDNPVVVASAALANLPSSNGYEGMAITPGKETLYPMLEGSVTGDPDNALRIHKADAKTGEFQGLAGYYPLEDSSHAIGDFAVVNEDEYLVIERDSQEAEEAEFKKIFKVDLSEKNQEGFVEKQELVDLLNIRDPQDLNQDGDTSFEFPFVTIEDVLVKDEDTIMVANDNNYPFSQGRPPEIDDTEMLLLNLDEQLDVDPRVGRDAIAGNPFLDSSDSEEQDGSNPEENTGTSRDNRIEGTASNDFLNGGQGTDNIFGREGNDELSGGTESDFLVAGAGNDVVEGGAGNDFLVGGFGDDLLEGNQGDDQLNGGDGSDTVEGGEGDDELSGDQGTDDIFGGEGEDELSGGTESDFLVGGAGEDSLEGGAAQDILVGGVDDDTLQGGEGDDQLNGGAGSDSLAGGEGQDQLQGGQGDDQLNGGAGSDSLAGGEGQDTFMLAAGEQMDTIDDFQAGEDFLELESMSLGDLSITQNEENTLLNFNNETLATLTGVQADTIENVTTTFTVA